MDSSMPIMCCGTDGIIYVYCVLCYIRWVGLNIPSQYKVINNHQSQPSLQQTPLGKYQSETANHRPGKQDMLSQYASVKPDKLSQHAKQRQAIPACIAKDTV